MFNFKDFKKIKEDSKEVHMQHPKGHTIIIAVKSLPKTQQEALRRLPLADGGEIKLKEKAKDKTAHYDKGTPDQPISQDDATSDQKPVTVNVNQAPQTSPAATQASAPVNVTQPNVPTTNPPVILPNGSMSAPGAAQTGQEALQGQQAIDTSAAQAMVPVEQARLRAVQLNAQQDQNNINALRTHADNLAANIKNIDPDAYRKNMSAPDKVAMGLGLFLGGFSVPWGGQNFAQEFLNHQIDRDIQGQIANQDKQRTIWGAYNSLYNNQNLASNMTKASMADAYKDQAALIAAKLGTPQARVNYQKIASDTAIIKNKAILDAAGNLRSTPNNPEGGSNVPGASDNNIRPVSAPGQGPQAQNKPLIPPDKYADSPILTSDAETKLRDLQYGSPQDKANYPKALEQYTQAQQADTLLSQLHEIHSQMYQDAKSGGGAGYLRRHDPTSHIPFLGPFVSGSSVQPATATPTNKEYDSLKTRLVGDIANSLRGTNIGGEEIQRIVNDNAPERNDPPELAAKKERTIRLFIKNAIQKSLLKSDDPNRNMVN
jgi:hypothetical protein